MSRRPRRTVPTVLLHDIGEPAPGHWLNWLAGQLGEAEREVRFPSLPNADKPDLAQWLVALRDALAGLPDDGFDVVAHSFGAALWLHHAAAPGDSPRPARVALVSPPDHEHLASHDSFAPVPLDIDAIRRAADGTVLVGSDGDPQSPAGTARTYGVPLKMATTVIPGGGHLDAESGYGPWPAVLDWCGRDNLAFIA